jgi:hypothetical protein
VAKTMHLAILINWNDYANPTSFSIVMILHPVGERQSMGVMNTVNQVAMTEPLKVL